MLRRLAVPWRAQLKFRGNNMCHFSEYYPTLHMPGRYKDKFINPSHREFKIPIDFYENMSEIFIDADLPGVDKKNIELTVDNTGTMHINAHKSPSLHDIFHNGSTKDDAPTIPDSVLERVESEMKFYVLERCSSNLKRSIRLPANADREFIKATFVDGSLHISIPKFEGGQATQHIEVE